MKVKFEYGDSVGSLACIKCLDQNWTVMHHRLTSDDKRPTTLSCLNCSHTIMIVNSEDISLIGQTNKTA